MNVQWVLWFSRALLLFAVTAGTAFVLLVPPNTKYVRVGPSPDLMLAGVILPQYAVGLVLSLALGPSAFLVLYSYLDFRREKRKARN